MPEVTPNKMYTTVGQNLYSLRVSQNKTITDVARAIKISPANLSKIEKGRFNFKLKVLLKLSEYYNVTPGAIVKNATVKDTASLQ